MSLRQAVHCAAGLWLALLAAGSLVSPATAVFRGSVEDASALAAGTWAPAPAWPLEISPGTSSPFGSPGGSASRIARRAEDGSLYLEFGELRSLSGGRPSVLVLTNLTDVELAVSLEVDLPAGNTGRALPLSSFPLAPAESREVGMLLCLSPHKSPGSLSGHLMIRVKGHGERAIPLRVGFAGRPVAGGSGVTSE